VSDASDWLKNIKTYLKSEGFPRPNRPDPSKLSLPDQDSKSLGKEYDYWEGWYTYARVKTTEYYILSRTTGTKSENYAYYKFLETLADIYESRVKRISREYSRREQEYRDNRV